MSDDLKKRLRNHVSKRGGAQINGAWRMMEEAADGLDARDAEIARLREALGLIASYSRGGLVTKGDVSGDRDEMIGIARTALPPSPQSM